MEWKIYYDAVTWLRDNWAKLRPWIMPQALASGAKPIPKNTFRIVLDKSDPPWWRLRNMGNGPATHVHARYYVTNIVNEKILVVGCTLKPSGTDQVFDLRRNIHQMRDGKKKTSTTLVEVYGSIQPLMIGDGETLEARIYFIDQFGNENSGPVTRFSPR
jgi:hypothetical protein